MKPLHKHRVLMNIWKFVIKEANQSYFLPSIQRELVWDTTRMTNLFDSLMQGYPIGSMLAVNYDKDRDADKLDFEVYKFIENYDEDSPHNQIANLNGIPRVNLVLDGQQRLTTLLIGLRGTLNYRYYRNRITEKLYINLLSKIEKNTDNVYGLKYEFKFFETPPRKEGELWIEAGKTLDFKEGNEEEFKYHYADEIRSATRGNDDLTRKANTVLSELFKVILEKDIIHIEDVETTDQEKILNIFVRANEGGVRLEKADLLLSYMESKKGLFGSKGARKEIKDFVDSLNKETENKPRYYFEKDDILKASLVLSNLPVRYILGNFNPDNLKKISDNWSSIKKYLSEMVELIARYGFSPLYITSNNALIPIAYYLMKNKKGDSFIESEEGEDGAIREEIIRWLVTSMLKRAFGGASDTTLESMRKGIDSGKSFKELVSGSELRVEDIERWIEREGYQTRYSHLILMSITDKKYWDKCHQDHIFPQDWFREENYRKMQLNKEGIGYYEYYKDSLANLQLLNPYINFKKSNSGVIEWTDKQGSDYKTGLLLPDMEYSFTNFLKFIWERNKLITKRLANVLGIPLKAEEGDTNQY